MDFWNEKEAKRLFEELTFCNVLIKKPCIKRLNNIDTLRELPFFEELSIAKTSNITQSICNRLQN